MKRFIKWLFGWVDYRSHEFSSLDVDGMLYDTRRSKLITGKNSWNSSVSLWQTEKGSYFELTKPVLSDYYFFPLSHRNFKVTLFNMDRETFDTLYCLDDEGVA